MSKTDDEMVSVVGFLDEGLLALTLFLKLVLQSFSGWIFR